MNSGTNTCIKSVFCICLFFCSPAGAQIITNYAGNGPTGGVGIFGGDGGPATAAGLFGPEGAAIDSVGNLYFADAINYRIRKINTLGIISTMGGNGSTTYAGDGVPATATGLTPGTGVAVDRLGNVFFVDGVYRIRKINPIGIISTYAGNGLPGSTGDGGPATAGAAQANDIAADREGNLFLSCGTRIRKIDTSGIITTVAGNGTPGFSGDGFPATSAELNGTYGVVVDKSGSIYINEVIRIRKVDTAGIIHTIAGDGTPGFAGDGSMASAAEFRSTKGLSVNDAGNLYISDQGNNRIRMITASGRIITIAGNGYGAPSFYGHSGDGGPADSAALGRPIGIACSKNWDIYFADAANNRVRKVALPAITVTALPGDTICTGTSVTFTASVTNDTSVTYYQWLLNGAPVGEGTATYVTDTLHNDDAVSCVLEYMVGDTLTSFSNNIIMSVNDAGTLAGASVVCLGDSIVLTHTAIGGIWGGSNGSASVAGGVVTGIAPGADTVYYSITNTCGTDTAKLVVTVNNCALTAPARTNGAQTLRVLPNPNEGSFGFILSSAADENVQVVITNMLGQPVKELTIITNKLTTIVLDAPAGVYSIAAATAHRKETRQVVLVK